MIDVKRTMDFGNISKIINLPNATEPQQPATLAQLNSVNGSNNIIPKPEIGLEATNTQEAVEELQEEINTNKLSSNLPSKWANALQ